MQISELQEETQDLDWFGLDDEGAIGHFTTGGHGALPRSVASSIEDLQRVTEFFTKQCVAAVSPIVCQGLDLHVVLKDEGAKARYLKDYIKMASHGLFSYDYIPMERRPTGYFQVAKPSTPLHVTSLPQEIRQILERTVIHGISFRTAEEIRVALLR
jgi:hypothetical protein